MICIRHRDFWECGSRGEASLSQPLRAVCHLLRYPKWELSSCEDAVTVRSVSIKLWTLLVLLHPCPSCAEHMGPLPAEPSPWASLGLISLSTTASDTNCVLQLQVETQLLGESGEMHFGRGEGMVWLLGGSSQDSISVSPGNPRECSACGSEMPLLSCF